MKAQTDKLAHASPLYARLLNSARSSATRRRELARFLDKRRKRVAFEQALREVRLAG